MTRRKNRDTLTPQREVDYRSAPVATASPEFELKDLYHPQSKYTPEEKINAVMTFLVTGSSKQVEIHTGIPHATVRDWKTRALWWPDVMATCRRQKQDELDAMFTKTIHKVVGQIADRVEEGDSVVGKDGSLTKKPVSAKDLATITGILYDKRALLRHGDVHKTERSGGENDRLKKLEERMAEFTRQANAKVINHVDVGETTPHIEDLNNG